MLKDDIQKRILTTLKEGKTVELNVLRFLLSLLKYAEIEKQKELTDDEILALMQKEAKKRKEAIVMFKNGGRQDLVDSEEEQIKVIEKFLPVQMSDDEIRKIVDEKLKTIEDKSNIGKVMGQIMPLFKGKADGALVSRLVKEKLTQ